MPDSCRASKAEASSRHSFFGKEPVPSSVSQDDWRRPLIPRRTTSLAAQYLNRPGNTFSNSILNLPGTPPHSDGEGSQTSKSNHGNRPARKPIVLTPTSSSPISTPGSSDDEDAETFPSLISRAASLEQHTPSPGQYHHRSRHERLSYKQERFIKQRRCISAGMRLQKSTQAPDRFIPIRGADCVATERFRSTDPLKDLSLSEKLLRSPDPDNDPFIPLISPKKRKHTGRLFSEEIAWRRPQYGFRRVSGPSGLIDPFHDGSSAQMREPSVGAVWNVGGAVPSATARQGPPRGVPDGKGGRKVSGSHAPYYTAAFVEESSSKYQDGGQQRARVATALDMNLAGRVLSVVSSTRGEIAATPLRLQDTLEAYANEGLTTWQDGQWVRSDIRAKVDQAFAVDQSSHVPNTPFRVLDAPSLRDDYYCSVLAYCETLDTLAVGLGNRVYCWRESLGVKVPYTRDSERRNTYVTSLSFSSTNGGHAILAIGRADATFGLWSLHESQVRMNIRLPNPIASVSFKPVTTTRHSHHFGMDVDMEELLVGDDAGFIYYYSIEWLSADNSAIHGFPGEAIHLLVISAHTQQICGLIWSPDGEHFVSGGNDNDCHLFSVQTIFKHAPLELCPSVSYPQTAFHNLISNLNLSPSPISPSYLTPPTTPTPISTKSFLYTSLSSNRLQPFSALSNHRAANAKSRLSVSHITRSSILHTFPHSAAVKAMAFCPWQKGLLATGGGSNDRSINFWHIFSGARLATIDTAAQVTGLVWSLTKREIAATFGYAQPEHRVRIAVFGWPDCELRGKVVWQDEGRALGVVRYPGGPSSATTHTSSSEVRPSRDFHGNGSGREGTAGERTRMEGCIVVASSDESVKFHEVWTGRARGGGGRVQREVGSASMEALGKAGGGFGGKGVLEERLMMEDGEESRWHGIR